MAANKEARGRLAAIQKSQKHSDFRNRAINVVLR